MIPVQKEKRPVALPTSLLIFHVNMLWLRTPRLLQSRVTPPPDVEHCFHCFCV